MGNVDASLSKVHNIHPGAIDPSDAVVRIDFTDRFVLGLIDVELTRLDKQMRHTLRVQGLETARHDRASEPPASCQPLTIAEQEPRAANAPAYYDRIAEYVASRPPPSAAEQEQRAAPSMATSPSKAASDGVFSVACESI